MKYLIKFLLFCICIVYNADGNGSWNYIGVFGGGNCDLTFSFSIGGKGYVGGGRIAWTSCKSDVWEFDPILNVWVQKASFPGGNRGAAACFVANNKAYVGLGYNGSSYYNDLWEYDPLLNNWLSKASFPGAARYSTISFSINNLGYIGTGYNGSILSDFWQYNPSSNSWSQKNNFPGPPRQSASSFVIGNSGYLVCGFNNGTSFNDLWEYIPGIDQWIQKASFPGTPKRAVETFVLNNEAYVGLGNDNVSYYVEFYKYNPINNSWIQESNFGGVERYLTFSLVLGNKAYIGTGSRGPFSSPTFLNDVWEFIPGITSLDNGQSFVNSAWFDAQNNLFNIELKDNFVESCSLKIFNHNGQIVMQDEKTGNVSSLQFEFKSKLSSGIYLYLIDVNNNRRATGKFHVN